jgi:hypothetical protein
MYMTGLLEFIGRPKDFAALPAYLRRCRERISEIDSKLRELEQEKQRYLNEIWELQQVPEQPSCLDLTEADITTMSAQLEVVNLEDSDEEVQETNRLSQSQREDAAALAERNPDILPSEVNQQRSFTNLNFDILPIPILQLWMDHFGLKSKGVSKSFMLSHLKKIQVYLTPSSVHHEDHSDPQEAPTPKKKKPRINRRAVYKWFTDFIGKNQDLYNQVLLGAPPLNASELFERMKPENPPGGIELLKDYFDEYSIQFR